MLTIETTKTTTLQLITRVLPDGTVEIIADGINGYDDKERLKALGYQFCKDRSLGLGTDCPLDQNGARSTSSVWRKILAVLPKEATPEQTASILEAVIGELDSLKKHISDIRIKGGKNTKLKLIALYTEQPAVADVCDRIAAMDTPWQPTETVEEVVVLTPGE